MLKGVRFREITPSKWWGSFKFLGWRQQLGQIFGIQTDHVAEVFIPTAAYEKPTFRIVLPEPRYFGAVRGYWQVYYEQDHLETERSLGLLVTAQITAASREDA